MDNTLRERGFTIMEVSVTVAILSILLGIGTVALLGEQASGNSLITSKRKVAALLHNARMEARATKLPTALIVRHNNSQGWHEVTIAQVDSSGDSENWMPLRSWVRIGGEVETDYSSEDYPNAFQFLRDDAHWAGCIAFDRNGNVIMSEADKADDDDGGYLILAREGHEVQSDADLVSCEVIYINALGGGVVLF